MKRLISLYVADPSALRNMTEEQRRHLADAFLYMALWGMPNTGESPDLKYGNQLVNLFLDKDEVIDANYFETQPYPMEEGRWQERLKFHELNGALEGFQTAQSFVMAAIPHEGKPHSTHS